MQQIAPEVTAIQEKYKKDPKKAQLEIMNLYGKEESIHVWLFSAFHPDALPDRNV